MTYMEHSSIVMPCQPPGTSKTGAEVVAATRPNITNAGNATQPLARRYGPSAIRGGYAAIPHVVLKTYRDLGVTTSEWTYICALWHFWQTDNGPCPSVTQLATQLGVDPSTLRRYRQSLERKRLLRVTRRGRHHAYDLTPLIEAAVAYDQQALVPTAGDSEQQRRSLLHDQMHDHLARCAVLHANKDIEEESRSFDDDSTMLFHQDSSAPLPADLVVGTGETTPLDKQSGQRCAESCVHSKAGVTNDHSPATHPARSVSLHGDQPLISTSTPRDSTPHYGDHQASPEIVAEPIRRYPTISGSGPGRETSLSKASYDEHTLLIQHMTVLSSEFGDASPQSSATRLRRLFQASGSDGVTFMEILEIAAARTRRHRATIYRGCASGQKNCTPYLFRVLENLLTAHAATGAGAYVSGENAQTESRQFFEQSPYPSRRFARDGWMGTHEREPSSPLRPSATPPPTVAETNPVWRAILEEIRHYMTPTNFARWLLPTQAVTQDHQCLTIRVPDECHRTYLSERINHHVAFALTQTGYPTLQVRYIVDPSAGTAGTQVPA